MGIMKEIWVFLVVYFGLMPEWTPDVQLYSSKEYPRLFHARQYDVRGSLALPVFEPSGQSCVSVAEPIMTSQKINYAPEVDKVCKALEAVNLKSYEILDRPSVQVVKMRWLKYWRSLQQSVRHTSCLWHRLGFHAGIEVFWLMVVVYIRAVPALMGVAWDKCACQQVMWQFMSWMLICGVSELLVWSTIFIGDKGLLAGALKPEAHAFLEILLSLARLSIHLYIMLNCLDLLDVLPYCFKVFTLVAMIIS